MAKLKNGPISNKSLYIYHDSIYLTYIYLTKLHIFHYILKLNLRRFKTEENSYNLKKYIYHFLNKNLIIYSAQNIKLFLFSLVIINIFCYLLYPQLYILF
jgi:hypothetical protein